MFTSAKDLPAHAHAVHKNSAQTHKTHSMPTLPQQVVSQTLPSVCLLVACSLPNNKLAVFNNILFVLLCVLLLQYEAVHA